MRKAYAKPDIVFESFALSTSIAGNCEVKTYTPNSGNCGYKFGGIMVFITDVTGCKLQIPDGSENIVDENGDAFCYHNPSEDNNLFNS
jgi:hypothetical protein